MKSPMYCTFRKLWGIAAVLLAASVPAAADPIRVSDGGGGQLLIELGGFSFSFSAVSASVTATSPPPGGTILFTPPSASLTITIATGVDTTLRVDSLPSGFVAPTFDLLGGVGNDDFEINVIHAGGPYFVSGGPGFNTLDVSGIGLPLFDTGSSILLGSTPIINYTGIARVVGAAPIPEPGSLALCGIGLASLLARRRRRRHIQGAR